MVREFAGACPVIWYLQGRFPRPKKCTFAVLPFACECLRSPTPKMSHDVISSLTGPFSELGPPYPLTQAEVLLSTSTGYVHAHGPRDMSSSSSARQSVAT